MNEVKLPQTIEHLIVRMTAPDNSLHLASQIRYLADLMVHSAGTASLPDTIAGVQAYIRDVCMEQDQIYSVASPEVAVYTTADANLQVLHLISMSFNTSDPELVISTLYDMSEDLRKADYGLYIRHPVMPHEALDALADVDRRFAYIQFVVQDGTHAIVLPSMTCTPRIEHSDLQPGDEGISTKAFISPDTGKYGSGAYQALRSVASSIIFFLRIYGSICRRNHIQILLERSSYLNGCDLDPHELLVELLTYGLAYGSPYWSCVAEDGKIPGMPSDTAKVWNLFLSELLPKE